MSDYTETDRKFPIKDVNFHESSLREMDQYEVSADGRGEVDIILAWHSTALAYLQFGDHHNLDGPGNEDVSSPPLVLPRAIERTLTLGYDDNGLPFMIHKFKE